MWLAMQCSFGDISRFITLASTNMMIFRGIPFQEKQPNPMHRQNKIWETDFHPVLLLRGIVLFLRNSMRLPKIPAQYWIKIVHLWVQKNYPVLGLESGEGSWCISRLRFYTG